MLFARSISALEEACAEALTNRIYEDQTVHVTSVDLTNAAAVCYNFYLDLSAMLI
jgi:hypothetical protein